MINNQCIEWWCCSIVNQCSKHEYEKDVIFKWFEKFIQRRFRNVQTRNDDIIFSWFDQKNEKDDTSIQNRISNDLSIRANSID